MVLERNNHQQCPTIQKQTQSVYLAHTTYFRFCWFEIGLVSPVQPTTVHLSIEMCWTLFCSLIIGALQLSTMIYMWITIYHSRAEQRHNYYYLFWCCLYLNILYNRWQKYWAHIFYNIRVKSETMKWFWHIIIAVKSSTNSWMSTQLHMEILWTWIILWTIEW